MNIDNDLLFIFNLLKEKASLYGVELKMEEIKGTVFFFPILPENSNFSLTSDEFLMDLSDRRDANESMK